MLSWLKNPSLKPHTAPSFLGFCLKRGLDAILIGLMLVLLFLVYGIIPNRWYHILVVNSGSMSPTFEAGDLIVITRPPENLEAGMVLTMMINGELVTHRLVGFDPDGRLVTRGDANPAPDSWGDSEIRISGLYRFRIPYLGFAFQYLPGFGSQTTVTGSWFVDTDSIALAASLVTSTPTLTPTPDVWDKSSLTLIGQGWSCESGGSVWAIAVNTGQPMSGETKWELYLGKDIYVASGSVPALDASQGFLISFSPTQANTYKFKVYQRPGHPGKGEAWSKEIHYDTAACNIIQLLPPTPSPIPSATLPTVLPVATSFPIIPPTTGPVPTQSITPTPTQTPIPSMTLPVSSPQPSPTPSQTPSPTATQTSQPVGTATAAPEPAFSPTPPATSGAPTHTPTPLSTVPPTPDILPPTGTPETPPPTPMDIAPSPEPPDAPQLTPSPEPGE